MKQEQYREGNRDAIYITENPEVFLDEKYFVNEILFKDEFNILKEKLISVLNNSEYSRKNIGEFKKLKEALIKISPVEFAGIVANLSDKDFISKYKPNTVSVNDLSSQVQEFLTKISKKYLPLQNAMDFVASEESNTKLQANDGDEINYLPSKNLSLNVPWPKVANMGTYTAKELSKFEKNMKWTINKTYLFKNDMAVLEMIARNNWKRPIYFATSVPYQNYYGLQKYFRLEGFAYKLVPY